MLEKLLQPEIEELIREREFKELRQTLEEWPATEIATLIEDLSASDDVVVFRLLPRELAADAFEYLSHEKQMELVEALAGKEHRLAELLNDLAPDDRTAMLEELPGPVVQRLLNLLSAEELKIAISLLGYPDESIGRLMTPEYVAVRPGWTVARALEHIRRHGRDSETLNVIYVVDASWHLIDDLRLQEIILAQPDTRIEELMDEHFVALRATDDQETAVQEFRAFDREALPVTDARGVLVGIVTIDDVLDVAEEEATEDIQMLGGSEALDAPYMSTPFGELVKKRARWLIILFLGEMLTATAMGYFQDEIARAVILALFVPLIISSGGNSGSQAAALIIRALAIGELRLSDWLRVMKRELLSGLALGTILGVIGVIRIMVWQQFFGTYGVHWMLIALTVGFSLVGVVLWGTVSGAMLPFIMQRLGADPATSSTPFVATLVDVTGLIIYFTVAALLLSGTLL
jgi:magnesium transporter